ncbi:Complex I intermediate-associated protein 30 [Pleurostoma richardsiae]|uniref:Complex I intermediate-associated protein 30 n=1 Tax=Pleurostoma richardsiae TaxID=41990 RepID=A0AA38VM96_9PEZI|nr:Complex I intermediate-associated protein 30 [Pleurostoma richardsiae]
MSWSPSSSDRSGLRYIFGGDRPWDASQWTASDDRVRGGKSRSRLTSNADGSSATFSGHLDISTLGGAGFASQRTRDSGLEWDLSGYDAIVLDVAEADGKRYTLTLKDTVLPRRGDGREQSTVSWEYDFVCGDSTTAGEGAEKVVMRLVDFRPTYRGKPKPDAKPLDVRHVKRISFMMRSFFGDQEGDFSLTIRSLAATDSASRDSSLDSAVDLKDSREDEGQSTGLYGQGWLSWLCGRRV